MVTWCIWTIVSTWEGHLQLLENVFKSLQAAGLTLKSSKVQFGPREVKCFVHAPTANEIRIGEERIKAIVNLPTPKTIKELRSALGVVKFVRKFIPDLAGYLITPGSPHEGRGRRINC